MTFMPGSRAPSLPKTSSPEQLRKKTGSGIAVFDFDGTLAPFRVDPSAVRLGLRASAALKRLAGKRPVVIVSGRPLSFLRKVTAGLPVTLIGSHGAEASLAALQIDLPAPASAALEAVLRGAEKSGLLVERKPYGRVIHFRALPDAERGAAAGTWAARLNAVLPAEFELLRGNAVLEVRPRGMHKGSAFPQLRSLFQLPVAVVLGDDTTDEDMFAALRPGELGVLVGERRPSLASLHLAGIGAVRDYAAALGRA